MLLGLDPGKKSGLASWHVSAGKVDLSTTQTWEAEHMEAITYVASALGRRRNDGSPLVEAVVCEAFVITAQTLKKTREPWSIEQIGAVRWLCRQHGVQFFLQTPAAAKAFATDVKLRALGLWSGSDHERDALRQLVRYAAVSDMFDDAARARLTEVTRAS